MKLQTINNNKLLNIDSVTLVVNSSELYLISKFLKEQAVLLEEQGDNYMPQGMTDFGSSIQVVKSDIPNPKTDIFLK